MPSLLNSTHTYTLSEYVYYVFTAVRFSTCEDIYSNLFINIKVNSDNNNAGVITGIAVAVVAAIAIIILVVVLIVRFGHSKEPESEEELTIPNDNAECNEYNLNKGVEAYKDMNEDPFANDFEEQGFVAHL